ncbi:hypothetical protein GGG87_08235 [Streptococcus sp. zg-86]|uniref:Uncharacterized protein n=1 Tax=Streptococcus zhangguiae TaxID=2664091 RepID=A0A6I4RKC9_9STRE|nr:MULTISPECIES: hypothetical protein [unclassified Streptococcus]MTB64984.1 hypothetical protein [Streptococcus sp. zg-86]MTB91198.1 hypothetical protein [Streptococcus sp. zg-36]MWV56931.1 hypothetical protein [Streptococcus sp. zg-70]QTH47169.1 hypothetical protein J5M87_06300 [Streptococcus sp. zg-86]
MNIKLVYRMGVYSLLGLSLLTACSHSSEKTSPSSDLPALTNTLAPTDYKTIPAKSGLFSIQVPSDWIAGEDDTSNDFSAYSAGNDYFITANLYPKVDSPLGLEDFARSLLMNSQETKTENLQLLQTTIAGKSGFLFTKEVNKEKQLVLFFYEEGEDYHLITLVTHPDNHQKGQEFLAQAIATWTSLATTRQVTFDYGQAITIPNSALTVGLPTSWKQDTEDVPADTTIYQDSSNGIRLSIRGVSTTGYIVNLNEIADQVTPANSNPSKEEVTLGNYQGYRLSFNQTSNTQSNYIVSIYVFHVNDTLITFTGSSKASNTALLQSTMETIISSMK